MNKTKAESESVENIKLWKYFEKYFPAGSGELSWTSARPACCHQGVFHTFKFRPELTGCSAGRARAGEVERWRGMSSPHPCPAQPSPANNSTSAIISLRSQTVHLGCLHAQHQPTKLCTSAKHPPPVPHLHKISLSLLLSVKIGLGGRGIKI